MSELTSVDVIDAPAEELSDDELRVRAERLRAYEAELRQRLRAELARRAGLVRRVGVSRASRGCRQPRAG